MYFSVGPARNRPCVFVFRTWITAIIGTREKKNRYLARVIYHDDIFSHTYIQLKRQYKTPLEGGGEEGGIPKQDPDTYIYIYSNAVRKYMTS